MKSPNLIRNSIQTPDGTVLISRHVHNYVTHVDANGKEYMLDGGLDYCRRSAHGDEVDLCIYDDEPHDVQRSVIEWGTYGPDGDQPLTRVKVADMDTSHIKAVLGMERRPSPYIYNCMVKELEVRDE